MDKMDTRRYAVRYSDHSSIIGVTVAVNTQTQRMALKIQETNTEAMRFQARAPWRDEKQRFIPDQTVLGHILSLNLPIIH
ncbi:hypothetical protein [Thermoactinomyces sp. DSM 45892]|uniref:hypothetical protein n=1 Tax=Thermoactinomyces sp. DSM 45892 TaxID=1882753 RepID=UPI000B87B832|nr:hypothetical protein [Thermoactinomyces sp. DSM 45892]